MRDEGTRPALTRRNVDMSLLNGIASTLTSSLELDEILNKTLGLVMNYMKVEAGEIFLLEEDKTTLRMVLHRGQAAEAFWTAQCFNVGDGYPGMVAQTAADDQAGTWRTMRISCVMRWFRLVSANRLHSPAFR
jgi:hypothetical protein